MVCENIFKIQWVALRSHDQFKASYWAIPPPLPNFFLLLFFYNFVELLGGGSVIDKAYLPRLVSVREAPGSQPQSTLSR